MYPQKYPLPHIKSLFNNHSCRRKEYSLEKVEVDEINPKPSGITPPDLPDILPGTTQVIIFYAGTMYAMSINVL